MAEDKQKEIKVVMDAKTLEDAGYDSYLAKEYGSNMENTRRYVSAQDFLGGALGSNTVIEIGNIRLDGKEGRIVIREGQDLIVIGKQIGGF